MDEGPKKLGVCFFPETDPKRELRSALAEVGAERAARIG
jgi:hypothetical protein